MTETANASANANATETAAERAPKRAPSSTLLLTPIEDLYKMDALSDADGLVLDLAEAMHLAGKADKLEPCDWVTSWEAQVEAHAFVSQHGLVLARKRLGELRELRKANAKVKPVKLPAKRKTRSKDSPAKLAVQAIKQSRVVPKKGSKT